MKKQKDLYTSQYSIAQNTELKFSETELQTSFIIIKNKTKFDIDLRNNNTVVKTSKKIETVEKGQTGMFEIAESSPMNFKNYPLFYVYTYEHNFSLAKYCLLPENVYWFDVSDDDGLDLKKEIPKLDLL